MITGQSITKRMGIMGRVILSVIFFTSGISKAINIDSFSEQVIQYSVLYLHPILAEYSKQISVFICCIEVVLSVGVWISKLRLFATTGVCVLILFFLYLSGVNYLYPTMIGRIESCGCFGEFLRFSPKDAFIKNIILSIVACLLFYQQFMIQQKK